MAKKSDKKKGVASPKDYATLIRPIITEKSATVGGGGGSTIVFQVNCSATKPDIRTAVERIFDVDVKKVRTINSMGKLKRTTRSSGRQASTKKAYVTLAEGQTVDIVDGL